MGRSASRSLSELLRLLRALALLRCPVLAERSWAHCLTPELWRRFAAPCVKQALIVASPSAACLEQSQQCFTRRSGGGYLAAGTMAELDAHDLWQCCQCCQWQGLSGCADHLLRQRGFILLAGPGAITASPEQADLVRSCRTFLLLRSQNWLVT